MNKIKCPICDREFFISDFKEIYVSPYNNKEYKRYECQNCEIHWEPLKILPEFYEGEVFEGYVTYHKVVGIKLTIKPFLNTFPLT